VAAPRPRRISDFKPALTNLAQTSHYQVIFGGLPLRLRQHLNVRGVGYRFITETSGLLCYSASLPGSSLATANIKGNYAGVVENMAHTRLYTEIGLEFYVDNEYRTMKFLEHWMEFIANGSGHKQSAEDYFYRMEYPEDYKANETKIIKFDRDYAENIEYKFIGLFPRDLSSVPVKYEGSEILKASVRFSYDRYVCGRHDSYSLNRGNDDNKEETSENKSSGATFVPAKHGSGVGYRRIEDRNNPNSPIYYDKDFTRPVP
jgi:hypothetical protein